MRELTHNELAFVSGGELVCTASVGPGGASISCTGSLSDWKNALTEAANAVADFVSSLFG